MKFLNFIIIKLTTCLVAGICLAFFIKIPLSHTIYATAFFICALFVSYIMSRQHFIKTIRFGLLAFLTTISIGALVVNLHNQKHFENHYSHYISSENDAVKTITFRVREVLKSGNYHDKYIVDVLKIEDDFVLGKLLLNVEKDTLTQRLKVDDRLIIKAAFQNINAPLNPNQFDYVKYLEKQYIYHQVFANNATLFKVSTHKHTVLGLAARLRENINVKLRSYNFKADELAIINALLLGQRQDIDKDIYDNYTNAGAVHILAVSGLHVGIVFLMLSVFFKPLERLKHGILIKAIIIVGILWSFAIIAGLSASVTRAVTMFSIVAIGMHLKRPANIYNTLAISMFVLLLFKPMFLFDVGFQLSYAAVFAIVWIYPMLYKLWKPKYKIVDKFWQVFVVTTAAQFGVVPLSLFYFHQFPGLFFVSNLVIVPVLGFILGFGILVILLALLNILPNFIAEIYGSIIGLMNDFVQWISHQEQFLIKDISFGTLSLVATYIFIILLVRFYQRRNYSGVLFLLFTVLLGQSVMIYNKYQTNTNEFTIFHKSRYSLIAHKHNTELFVTHNVDSIINERDKTIRNYKVAHHIKNIHEDSVKSVYLIKDKTLLVIDSLGVYNVKSFKPDYILLRNSPKVNLNRLIDSIKPKLIIADGSNYKSYIKRWEATCLKRKLPLHRTGKKGAFLIEYAK